MSAPKYRPADKLSVHEVVTEILEGRPIYMRNRVWSAAWAKNLSLAILAGWARMGVIRRAVKRGEG